MANPYANTTANDTRDRYIEAEVMNADPVKLTAMLFRGSVEAVGAARRALAAGNIALRSQQIMKAWAIVRELDSVLDHPQGGALSLQFAELYAYIGGVLLQANAEQSDAKLSEAERLLATLNEGWSALSGSAASPAEAGAASEGSVEYRPISQAC